MTTFLLIASLGLASLYGYWMMTKLDGFLSCRKEAAGSPSRRRFGRMPLGRHASILLHAILNHRFN